MTDIPQIASGSAATTIDRAAQRELLAQAFGAVPDGARVLVVPPDFTRFHSGAGAITEDLYALLGERCEIDILPALGTHTEMTARQKKTMFGEVPEDRFRVHDWRSGVVDLGEVPGDFVREVSGGRVDYSITAQVGKLVAEGGYDLIVSAGQVVPHEVVGMANHNKNLLVGTGGPDTIHKTHFLGAVVGIEAILGRGKTPVRDVFDRAEREFLSHLPIVYVLTVRQAQASGDVVTRGLYVGAGTQGFHAACELSREVNINAVDAPLSKVVVWLDPEEFKSTWLGNKSVYRTRMAMADEGELLVLAPGLEEFGEDSEIDRLIRKHGYRTTPEILRAVEEDEDLRRNRSAAAHLIHGSSEGRFRIVYAPGRVSREEIESVGYEYTDLEASLSRYDPRKLVDGPNLMPDGEEIFFVRHPGLGLWATRDRLG